ncbi:MAG TPA: metal-dependent hydrolase [Vicinamibacterales bacterium]|jgi:membrane-bound metal-dependent hydrolase YbcI (DUF457 family)|nr:metal-dependent hydrolase [Vicinamibacterales bacterium]
MDTLSHAGWGYASLHAKRALAWWGALAGAAPDLLFFIPSRIEGLIERGWASLRIGGEPGMWRADGPPLPPELVEAYSRYYIKTHSLVFLAVAAAVLMLIGKRHWAWLAVPYGLHILMDIPTHERYQTQPFYPLSSWSIQGLTWGDPRIFFPNLIALVATLAWVAFRRRQSRTENTG